MNTPLPDVEFVLDPFTELVAAESAGEHKGNVSWSASLHETVLLEELQPLVKVFPSEGDQPNFTRLVAVRSPLEKNARKIEAFS